MYSADATDREVQRLLAAGAVAYASLIMTALATWWVDAVGTTALTLHVSWTSLAVGAAGGVAAAIACIWWTLRSLGRISERSLLAGQIEMTEAGSRRSSRTTRASGGGRQLIAAVLLSIAGVALMAGAVGGLLDRTGAFFGAGTALLAASLCFFSVALRRPSRHALGGHGWRPVTRLGLRNATHRPGRSAAG